MFGQANRLIGSAVVLIWVMIGCAIAIAISALADIVALVALFAVIFVLCGISAIVTAIAGGKRSDAEVDRIVQEGLAAQRRRANGE